jgi:hypothetical protein
VCPVVGALLVEAERDAAGRLPAVELFADAVAPLLRERFGWDGVHAGNCGLRPRSRVGAEETPAAHN